MRNTTVSYSIICEELRSKMRNDTISKVMKTGRLCWFDHMEINYENDWVRYVKCLEVQSRVPISRQKTTWNEVLRKDLKGKRLER